jgi:hypothetical protein
MVLVSHCFSWVRFIVFAAAAKIDDSQQDNGRQTEGKAELTQLSIEGGRIHVTDQEEAWMS